MRRRFAYLGLIGVLAVGSAACPSQTGAEIVLAIDSDLAVPSEVSSLSVQVQGPSGVSEPLIASLNGGGAVTLPATLNLRTPHGPSTPVGVKLCAVGGSANGLCISQQAAFPSGNPVLWVMRLSKSCLTVCCSGDQTCNAGVCVPTMNPANLVEWTGDLSGLRQPQDCDRGGNEFCNGLDDDCDGQIDEDFNLQSDASNCGACGRRCGAGGCVAGRCGNETLVSIAAGKAHACVVRATGGVVCWGSNSSGQLGDATRLDSATPVAVAQAGNAVEVVAGNAFSCARSREGVVSCWGDDSFRQLGEETASVRGGAVQVTGLSGSVQISAGAEHACARTGNGAVLCWGRNDAKQVGASCGSACASPTMSKVTQGAKWVSAGAKHTCAVTAAGRVSCWGDNTFKQLGSADTSKQDAVELDVAGGAIGVAAGVSHTCAWTSGGDVFCWGNNRNAQLGMAANGQDSTTPADVGLNAATYVDASTADSAYSCAIAAGRVRCWGQNDAGQLGAGPGQDNAAPSNLTGINGAKAVATGSQLACAIDASSQVWCWGKTGGAAAAPTVPTVLRCAL